MRDVYGAKTEKAQWLRFHTQTAGVSLTAQQPYNNVVRTGIEALAAVLGGTNSLHTNALDETLALPSEQAAEIALRTQQVIMEETGVVNVADPLGGSWYVEALTDKIEAEANAIFDKILEMGGPTCATTRPRRSPSPPPGWGPGDAGPAARHRGRLVHVRDRRGRLRVPDRPGEGRQEGRRRERATRTRSPVPWRSCGSRTRSSGSRSASSPSVAQVATRPPSPRRSRRCSPPRARTRNMIPAMLEACRAEATLGEICDALRKEWGEYREPARF